MAALSAGVVVRWCAAGTRWRVGALQQLQGLVTYLEKVITAGGGFVYIPTGNSQERPCCTSDLRDGLKVLSAQTSPDTSVLAECPLVAYPQGGANYCATNGLASTLHVYGNAAEWTRISQRRATTLDRYHFAESESESGPLCLSPATLQ